MFFWQVYLSCVPNMPNTLHCPPGMLQDLKETFELLDKPQTSELKNLVRLWQEHQPEGLVYTRTIPSRKIASLLSSLIIWEPVDDWFDARVRLMGSGLSFRFGRDVKGQLMSELFSIEEFPHHKKLLRRAVTNNTPIYLRSRVSSGDMHVMTLDLVVLPIRDADGISPLLLVCVRRCRP